MEVLRAKIAKRIILQQQMESDNEARRKLFQEQSDEKKRIWPSRLNMEAPNRKTVMKILQDNKQKLRQTRQEMIDEMKKEKSTLV